MKRLALLITLLSACSTETVNEKSLLPDAMVHTDAGVVGSTDSLDAHGGRDSVSPDVRGGLVPGLGSPDAPVVALDGGMPEAMPRPEAGGLETSRPASDAGVGDTRSTQIFPGLCCGSPGLRCGPEGTTRGECCPSNMSVPSCQDRWQNAEWCYCAAGWECGKSTRERDKWECQRAP